MKTRTLQLLVNGAIDTKTNPKLVRGPALLQADNLYQLRTGEFRPRNGFSKLAAGGSALSLGDNLYVTPEGGIGSASRGLGFSAYAYPTWARYGNSTSVSGWVNAGTNYGGQVSPYPSITARVSQVAHAPAITDQVDPDVLFQGGLRFTVWTLGSAQFEMEVLEEPTGRGTGSTQFQPFGAVAAPTAGSAAVLVTTGGGYSAMFSRNGANLSAFSWLNGGTVTGGSTTPITDLAASPWFDAKAIPGTSKIAIAWKAAAGGIKCTIYDPSLGTISSTVATAGGDASFSLGWLDDQTASGNMYLATAGNASGVVVRVMSATTMVVSATTTISAGATVGIRNITGHTKSATTYVVMWDKSGATAIYDTITGGYWNGASASVVNMAAHMSIYSRSVKLTDGSYYLVAAVAVGSTTQAAYAVVPCDPIIVGTTQPAAQCYALSGEGGGRRQQCSLSSPVAIGSTIAVAVSRSKRINTPGGGTAQQGKTIAILSLTQSFKLTRARELGGTVFMPGGTLQRDDGVLVEANGFPISPEPATGVSSAGGGMTASGTYLYRTVEKTVDASGRVVRSAGSIPNSVTLGAGDGTVTLTTFTLGEARGEYPTGSTNIGCPTMEIYRAGPAASGATLYNKVGETSPMIPGAVTAGTAFVDTMSDANAALGEVAYFNGNTLENFSPPGAALLEVNGNRVGIVNAENPTEFWYSKEYKAGVGLGFNPQNVVNITGDGYGDLTGLAAMDGNWILSKRQAIYVMSGSGSDDTGSGSFNTPRAVSRTLGTINPISILETPDGIMFQCLTGGIWLLDRGFGLTYVGSPIEAYALAESVTGAALVASLSTARFLFPSGRMVEYDYFHKRWYTHQLRVDRSGSASTVVDCVNSALFGWCYLLANGDLMQESASLTRDTNGTTTSIIPSLSFPHLNMAGLAGYQRFRSLDIVLDVIGNHTFAVDAEYDYSGAVTGTPYTKALTTATPTFQAEYLPPEGRAKCTSVRPVLTVTGAPAGATFRITGATLVYGIKSGTNIPASGRLT